MTKIGCKIGQFYLTFYEYLSCLKVVCISVGLFIFVFVSFLLSFLFEVMHSTLIHNTLTCERNVNKPEYNGFVMCIQAFFHRSLSLSLSV